MADLEGERLVAGRHRTDDRRTTSTATSGAGRTLPVTSWLSAGTLTVGLGAVVLAGAGSAHADPPAAGTSSCTLAAPLCPTSEHHIVTASAPVLGVGASVAATVAAPMVGPLFGLFGNGADGGGRSRMR